MPKKRKNKKRRPVLLLFILTPPLAYAAYLLVLFFLDSFRGDGLILNQFLNESRGRLARQLISDGWRALPVFYAVGLLLWLEVHLLSRFSSMRGVLPAAIAGALTGWLLSALLIGGSTGVVAPYLIAGLLMAAILGWAGQRPAARKRR